ncbi:cupin domain-containing protein [Bradyrhizobium jicamae]|uniref:cupin domain-containing protein n=1 Tax=Bradyrhizobium jicamae TaxID=280332 RepID=UPI001BAB7CE9|nr:cupin domain-containing protein [Bradyrhizobium jicamae]MBR0755091.1 cupin domain-containing protein [Bradyrhizobium jicamae]
MKWHLKNAASILIGIAATSQVVAQDLPEQRLRFDQFKWPQSQANQAGSAMVQGQQVIFVIGDGKSNGLYSLVFKAPPNTKIQPHSHPDGRSCFILSGTWYFGYGTVWDESKLVELPAGSHYTEPAGRAHFAATKGEEVTVQCTATGPTGTTFVNPSDDPRNARK